METSTSQYAYKDDERRVGLSRWSIILIFAYVGIIRAWDYVVRHLKKFPGRA